MDDESPCSICGTKVSVWDQIIPCDRCGVLFCNKDACRPLNLYGKLTECKYPDEPCEKLVCNDTCAMCTRHHHEAEEKGKESPYDIVRDGAALGCLAYLKQLFEGENAKYMIKNKGHEAVFLLTVVATGPGDTPVRKAAKELGNALIDRLQELKLDACPEQHKPGQSHRRFLNWIQYVHGLRRLRPNKDRVAEQQKAIGTYLQSTDLVSLLGFDPNARRVPKTGKVYCFRCGRFATTIGDAQHPTRCPNRECPHPTRLNSVPDYDAVTGALVWCGLLYDLGFPRLYDTCTVDDVLAFIKWMWGKVEVGSVETLGTQQYQQQLYLLTHLFFVLTEWGHSRLAWNNDVFQPEFQFLRKQLDDCMLNIDDPELVAEIRHCMRLILFNSNRNDMNAAADYLLQKVQRYSGTLVDDSKPLVQRYHAAYVGVIGLMSWQRGPVQDKEHPPYEP